MPYAPLRYPAPAAPTCRMAPRHTPYAPAAPAVCAAAIPPPAAPKPRRLARNRLIKFLAAILLGFCLPVSTFAESSSAEEAIEKSKIREIMEEPRELDAVLQPYAVGLLLSVVAIIVLAYLLGFGKN